MRIIAGRLKGRQFSTPGGRKTHPMSDKARGGLFSVLGDISGLTVLDAFSGSGGLAFESLSRGAASVLAIDKDKAAADTISANARSLGLERHVRVIRANVSSWSDNNLEHTFDLVFCDPPYDQLQLTTLQKLVKHVNSDGTFVLSWPGDQQPLVLDGSDLIKQKTYGDAQLLFYQVLSGK